MSLHPSFHAPPPAHCGVHRPRQGHYNRVCVITRERVHRTFLFRVVRTSDENGKYCVKIGDAIGRSAYIQKQMRYVKMLLQKNKLAKALRCNVPPTIVQQLVKMSEEWERLSAEEKGLAVGEAYGLEGLETSVDEVQYAFRDEAWI